MWKPQGRVAGVGQESHQEADGLHADDQVVDGDRAQSRVATPTRSAAVGDPTAIPPGAGHLGHLLHSASE